MPGRIVRAGRTLAGRLLFFLSIALLPIGLIAVYQTTTVVREATALAERDILARTVEAAGSEFGLVQRAFGAAEAIGSIAAQSGLDSEACIDALARFVEDTSTFVFAGVMQADGVMECSSTGDSIDFSGTEDWQDFLANPGPMVTINRNAPVSKQSVMIVSIPFYAPEGPLLGVASVSIPHSLVDTLLVNRIEGLDLAFLDAEGKVLSTNLGIDEAEQFESLGVVPGELQIPTSGMTMGATDRDGENVTLAVVSLIPGDLYALGKWSSEEENEAQIVPFFGTATPAFPVVMWIASLIVAFFAVERLVLKHLTRMRIAMAHFSLEDDTRWAVQLPDAPVEIQQIAASFNAMAARAERDHAVLEKTVLEKDVLLKEVHHRVKNNLQLIASILNMQMRHIDSPEAKRVLRRVQDRVMSLATIHKSLYSEEALKWVRVDELLRQIIAGVLDVGVPSQSTVKTTISLSPVELDPDQAVPLSLLVTEAVTNAIKYTGTAEGAAQELGVSLSEGPDGHVTLEIRNSRGPVPLVQREMEDGTGLGNRLIAAFVSQLGGEFEIDDTDEAYALRVDFRKLGADLSSAEAAE